MAALAATQRPRAAPRSRLCIGALLAWLRPELALGVRAAARASRCAIAARRALALAIALAGVAALLIASRLAMFGDVLPLSLRAKAGSLAQGAQLRAAALLLATSLAGLGLVGVGALRGRSDDRVFGAVLLAHAVAVVLAGGDWMPGYRLLVPVLPLYALLRRLGARAAFARAARLASRCVLLAVRAAAPSISSRASRSCGERGARARRSRRSLARWLARTRAAWRSWTSASSATRATCEVIDLGGLTDPRSRACPAAISTSASTSAYLRARDPDAIVLHTAHRAARRRRTASCCAFDGYPVEQRVAAHAVRAATTIASQRRSCTRARLRLRRLVAA